MERAYLDHASTSPLRAVAREAMVEWLSAADPGRVHSEGRAARFALEDAREQVAGLLGTRPRQVVFTSGATEAINSATFGALAGGGVPGGVAVMAGVEHSAVREATARWATEVVEVAVDRSGRIDPVAVFEALDRGGRSGPVRLVHCQWANHEVGTVQPVGPVVEACRGRGVMVHVDAASAAGHVPIDFDSLGADLMSVSAHKLGGPRGVGALLVRRGLRVAPLLVGGAQERARRGGLENVAAAAGFGAAAGELAAADRLSAEAGEAAAGELAAADRLSAEAGQAAARIGRLQAMVEQVPGVTVFGARGFGTAEPALPHLLCIGVDGVEAEPVLIGLDQAGVAAHSGSSCSSEDLEPSPVLAAMGVDADHSLRFSVGWSSTDSDIETTGAALAAVVRRLRGLRT